MYTQAQLETILKSEGPKAVKSIALEMGLKPAHLGRMVVAQITLTQKLAAVESEARQLVETLGLSLMEKGNLKTVVDSQGEYITHAFQWGQLVLHLQAWKQAQDEAQALEVETVETVEEAVVEKKALAKKTDFTVTAEGIAQCHKVLAKLSASKSAYMVRHWQHENAAIRLEEHGDNNDSRLVRYVRVELKDGRSMRIGSFSQHGCEHITADYGRVCEHFSPTEEVFNYGVKMMMRFKGLTMEDLAEKDFCSKQYLGF